MFYTVISVFIILVSVLLVLIVLIQNSKGGGLAANFASNNSTFGARQTADILEKGTWYLITGLFVLCFIASAAIPHNDVKSNRESAVQRTFTPSDMATPPAGFQTQGTQQEFGAGDAGSQTQDANTEGSDEN